MAPSYSFNNMTILQTTVEKLTGRLVDESKISKDSYTRIHQYVAPLYSHSTFNLLPASRTNKHHFYVGGLVDHTVEVLHIAVAQMTEVDFFSKKPDWLSLIVGACWHDFGKTMEYTIVPHCVNDPGAKYTYEKEGQQDILNRSKTRPIHHITAGTASFLQHASKIHGYPGLIDWDALSNGDFGAIRHILHIIESHHGRREWGSPLVPATSEALAVHQADMLSVMATSGNNPGARP